MVNRTLAVAGRFWIAVRGLSLSVGHGGVGGGDLGEPAVLGDPFAAIGCSGLELEQLEQLEQLARSAMKESSASPERWETIAA